MAWITPRARGPRLRWMRWPFLALGLLCLGYVGFALLDAEAFQAYENWRLARAAKNSPVTAPSPPPSSTPLVATRRTAAPGATLGRIEIARIGVDSIIVEGTDSRSLRRAVGHVNGTAFPGEHGNTAIAGHRDTFFRGLRDLRQSDEITVTTLEGIYRYRVDSMTVVAGDDTAVLNDSAGSTLTLVTCYPFSYVGPAPQRFVVRAHLD